MKGSSPRQLAVFISLIATLLTGVVLVIGFFLEIKTEIWLLSIILGAMFCIIYFAVYNIMSDFIYEKIKSHL